MSNKVYPHHRTIALVFDADGTIHEKTMFRSLFKKHGFNENYFFDQMNELRDNLKKEDVLTDDITIYFLKMIEFFKEKNLPLTNEILINSGKNLVNQAFPGMPDAMNRYKEYVKEKYSDLGIEVENYIISSGSRKVLQGSDFDQYLNQIYACDTYMMNGIINLAHPMSDTMKTQALFRINKGYENGDHNTPLLDQYKRIPFELMIGFEDGQTGIPMLKLIKSKGGSSIGVYGENENKEKVKKFMEEQINHDRINAYFKADYSEESSLDQFIKQEIDEKVKLIQKN